METEEAKLVFTKYDEMLRLLSKYVAQFYHILVCFSVRDTYLTSGLLTRPITTDLFIQKKMARSIQYSLKKKYKYVTLCSKKQKTI